MPFAPLPAPSFNLLTLHAARRVTAAGWAWAALLGAGLLLLPLPAWWRSICLAPLLEEAVLRWALQDPLHRHLAPTRAAWPALVCAAVFAALHMATSPGGSDLLRAAATALPAWWIGHLYRHSRRLLPCIAWHAGFNLLWLSVLSKWLIA